MNEYEVICAVLQKKIWLEMVSRTWILMHRANSAKLLPKTQNAFIMQRSWREDFKVQIATLLLSLSDTHFKPPFKIHENRFKSQLF